LFLCCWGYPQHPGFGGHTEVADYLLSARADLAAQNSYDCDAGHFAGLGGSVAACEFLLEKGGMRGWVLLNWGSHSF